MQIAILGRQPEISLAELECLFGAENITPVGSYAALVSKSAPLPQQKLGGTMKSAAIITRLQNTDATQAFLYLQQNIVDYANEKVFDGKIQLGFSLYGYDVQKKWLLQRSLEIKKILKKAGRSVRIIENRTGALETAQILYNKLTGPQGIELLIIKDGNDVILAQTTAVQDIDAYAARDYGRPMRDAKVGMLPPKLAQIMLNLAVGEEGLDFRAQSSDTTNSKIQDPSSKISILDPFCGTGVVLQEALLMGFNAYGSDISEKMIDYTQENLQWLTSKFQIPNSKFSLETGDATTHTWNLSKIKDLRSKIYIVCETYLGKPLTSLPQPHELEMIIDEANAIAEAFLKNIAPQIKKGTRLCLALPAWALNDRETTNRKPQFRHLKMLDHLEDLGYNRLELVHAKKEDLLYHREDQIVARELTLLVRT